MDRFSSCYSADRETDVEAWQMMSGLVLATTPDCLRVQRLRHSRESCQWQLLSEPRDCLR